LNNDVPFTVAAHIATEWTGPSKVQVERAIAAKRETTEYLAERAWLDVPAYGGFSGSAVWDKTGAILGIVSGAGLAPIVGPASVSLSSYALGYIIPLDRLAVMLDTAKASYLKANAPRVTTRPTRRK
jgi:hypothetical protein